MDKLNVKVGDKVIVSNRWQNNRIEVVEKITPKGSIKVCGLLYTENGYQKGNDSFNRNTISIATEEKIAKIYNDRFISKVFKKIRDCKSLTYEQAIKIDEILNISVRD